ncbi:hypothetical protein HOS16_gp70 [Shigella phage vB_SflS-ISF001]|uniref:Uncharacterized protein n=1 Tax=Shigella phage vB_SflS-ISF001 TaxID=2048005 RepID=A0A2D1GQB3_9CAUD|nr:hypothetical protein HOS16_gp70 [Shigella phage vB_SflS-ISF001]ATN94148.1 hypothetical protein FLXISF001_070 [Shigella phage vB_SflS-ISF001]
MTDSNLRAAIDRANDKLFTDEFCNRLLGGIMHPSNRVVITQRDTGISITDINTIEEHKSMISYILRYDGSVEFGKLDGDEKEAVIDFLLENVSLVFEQRLDYPTTRWDCDMMDANNRIPEILEERL